MRVIHGIWAHGALCLWAEDPDLPPVSGSGPHDVRLPRPHPFACQAAELADMLAGGPGPADAVGDAARKAVHDELTLQLPSPAADRWPRRNSCGPKPWSRPVRPGAAGCRWPAGGCRCSPSGPRPRSLLRCWPGSANRTTPRLPRAGRWPT